MNHLMIDLETLGANAAPDVVVLSIGAVVFDPYVEDAFDDLHATGLHIFLDPQDQIDRGAKVDWSTVLWWANQDVMARTTMFNERLARTNPANAIAKYREYVISNVPVGVLWGNGPSFDNIIMSALHKRYGAENPFKYYQDRDVRTVGMLADLKRENHGVAHDALDDAVSQALYVQQCYKKLGLKR